MYVNDVFYIVWCIFTVHFTKMCVAARPFWVLFELGENLKSIMTRTPPKAVHVRRESTLVTVKSCRARIQRV